MRQPITAFSFAVLGFYLLLWGARWLSPGGAADGVVLVLVTIAGVALIRPGWNIRPSRPVGYWAALFCLLLGSTVLAAYVLRFFKIPVPYDTATLKIVTLLPGVVAVTGVEELLFRQVMFRWLEVRQISVRGAVLATSVAFGGAHVGAVVIPVSVDGPFYILQSLYMLWVGLLLGELRRATGSWVMSWAGHAGYNVTVLFVLSLNGEP